MEPNMWIVSSLAAVVVAPVAFLYGQKLKKAGFDVDTAFQKGPRGWVVLFGFILLMAALMICTRYPRLLHPAIMVYFEPMTWVMVQMAMLFMGMLAFPLSHAKPKAYPWTLLVLAFVGMGGVQQLQHYFNRPVDPKSIRVRIGSDGAILQSTNVTCTAAALANALRLFQIQSSEKECARVLRTRDSGTTDIQLLHGVRQFGIYGYYVPITPLYMLRLNRPAIISINLLVIWHSVLVYGHDAKGNFKVIDPAAGVGVYTPEKYQKKLVQNEGVVLTDQPVPNITPESPAHLLLPLQEILKQEKYLATVNGLYDDAMHSAVKAFQTQFKLKPTGVIDEFTYLLLTGPQQPTREFAKVKA